MESELAQMTNNYEESEAAR